MTKTFADSVKKTLLTEAEMETIERDLRDWSIFGVLVCGHDRRGQWGNPARPRTQRWSPGRHASSQRLKKE